MNMPSDITQWLAQYRQGDKAALDQLLPLVYDELRRVAGQYLGRERADHTLQPTALVHEVYLRLVNQTAATWQDRAHFLGMAATVMRHVLVDYARHRQRAKRGGAVPKLSLDDVVEGFAARQIDLVILDEALRDLAQLDPQQSRVVELRCFGGLTMEEIAGVLDRSLRTVHSDWRTARAWLCGRLRGTEDKGEGTHDA